jgi:hypothetical protein
MKTKLFIVVLVGVFMIIGTMLLNAEEMYDFEGETVTIITWTEHFHEDYHPERIERKEVAEEKFNVKIENLVIPYGEATETQISRLLAGDSEYDIWQMHSFKHYWIHVGEGHLYPISDVLPDSHYDDMLTGVLDYQGHKYHFNDPNPGWQAPVVVFWNKDLFEREGLPNLYELYENGNWTWEKATEIGFAGLIPLESKRTIVKYNHKKKDKKQRRWQRVAEAAAKQSGRAVVPEIKDFYSTDSLKNLKDEFDYVLLLWEDEKEHSIKEFFKENTVAAEAKILLIIGPEGGFSESEVNKFKHELEAQIITLGPRILRTETAGITSLTAILYEKGELGD